MIGSSPARLAAATCVLFLCIGCGGNSASLLEPYDGTRVLPSTRSIPHPDSTQDVQLLRTSDSVRINLDRPFATLTKKWSTQLRRGPYDDLLRPGPYNSYATLWGLEMRLAHLKRTGATTLSPDLARKRIQETIEAHRKTLTVDLNLFVNPTTTGGTPHSFLRQSVSGQLTINDDETYSLLRSEQAAVDRIRYTGRTIFHYQITLHFSRQKDGTDILDDAERIEVSTRPFHATARLSFEWRLDET